MKLNGRVAVVTGGARGLGYAAAKRFAKEGARVFIADKDEEQLLTAEASLRAEGFDVRSRVTDVSQVLELEAMLNDAAMYFGQVDIMLNNAGIAITKDFMTVTEEDFDSVMAVNLRGAFFGLKVAAKIMIEQGRGGVILNMSSINSRMANPSVATYAISKGGLNQVTSTAAVALAPYGIRVLGIGPGTIDTEMLNMGFLTNEAQGRMILSRTPMGRLGTADEVAAVAAFLASDDASYMTGQTVYPDGGRMVLNYVMPEIENDK